MNLVRKSNIELARILSMFLIVLLHSTYYSFGYPSQIYGNILVLLFSSISIFAVNVFLLITGYFSITPKLKSLCNLLFILFFASICRILLRYIVVGDFDINNLLFISKSNWFVISYFGLFLLSPILNTYIEKVTKKELLAFIVSFYLFSFYFSIFPKFVAIEPGFNNGCSVLWFLYVYLIGRYLRLYGVPNFFSKHSFILWIVSVLFIFVGQFMLVSIGAGSRLSWFGAQNQPLVIIAAISFFSIFVKLNITSKVINHIAKSTLFVLLLHSPNLTKSYFKFINIEYSLYVSVFLWLLGVVIIYVACTLIDQIRIKLYNKFVVKYL